ncbi:MAG: hypothetical protein HKN12_05200 [Gemmatimonadetes bacterium]|nr:hypothetical protein [Gemmatimonadota bacterium]
MRFATLLLLIPTLILAEDPPVAVLQWGTQGSGPGQFQDPWEVAVDDAGAVYVADNRNGRLQKFTADGTFVTEFGAFATGTYEPVFSVALDDSGRVLAGEHNTGMVQTFSTDGTFLFQWPVSAGRIPSGLAVGNDGSVFVASQVGSEILKYTSAGSLITSWSTGSVAPSGITVNASGDLYVSASTVVQKYAPDGSFIAQYGMAGTGDGQFTAATDVAVDANGDLIVTDWFNDRVQKLRSDGLYLSQWPLVSCSGVAVGPSGEIIVAHRHEIVRYEYVSPVRQRSWGRVKASYRQGARR